MKKGFTLIELLAVIVVLAILALVVTPIVLNIVENAQTGSDERSLEQYAKVMQTSYYEMKMKDTSLTLQDYLNQVDAGSVSAVSLTYNGSRVVCDTKTVSEVVSGTQTIELYNCTVDGRGTYQFVNGKAEKVEENDTNVTPPNQDESDDVENTVTYEIPDDERVVYFDVSAGELCSETDYKEKNSYAGYNGIAKKRTKCVTDASGDSSCSDFTSDMTDATSCLKFYKYKEDSTTQTMILDHNIIEEIDSLNVANNSLRSNTSSWKGTINKKLITPEEIVQITGNTNWSRGSFYFDNNTSSPSTTCTSGNISGCEYGWLYDRTSSDCESYGCLNNSPDSSAYRYWTNYEYKASSISFWHAYVEKNGRLSLVEFYGYDSGYSGAGVRPVITIAK